MIVPTDSGFPKFHNFKSLERNTFRYLRDCKVIKEETGFGCLLLAANIHYSVLAPRKQSQSLPIDFDSHFDLRIGRRTIRFHIGSLIRSDYSQATYYLAICDYNKAEASCQIMRKFHFDYDNGTEAKPHPMFHFQYAGKKPPGMGDHGKLYQAVLSPWLSEPRLPYPPMSLALLLNCVFVEFSTEITIKISEDNKWRELVKTNETRLLEPYYSNCKNFLSGDSHSPKKLFTSDYCYGKLDDL